MYNFHESEILLGWLLSFGFEWSFLALNIPNFNYDNEPTEEAKEWQ